MAHPKSLHSFTPSEFRSGVMLKTLRLVTPQQHFSDSKPFQILLRLLPLVLNTIRTFCRSAPVLSCTQLLEMYLIWAVGLVGAVSWFSRWRSR